MNKLFIFFLLTGLALPGFGQGRDTVFAVHKLFNQKRAGGKSMQSFGDSAASKAYNAERAGSPLTKQEVRRDALFNTGFYVAGTLKASDYSPENEAAIIRHYQAGGFIPPAIRRKLKRKHFHRTTRDVVNARN
ncbi:MAG TPA: hypothetical protein VF629_07790 [Hymenobacter sp.]|jgi:hypothetical protein|uniref:hypothetical protein n=1 Tax=Hymenobacter sp. TaxID=1898978 RepID=UPI002ED86FD5